MKKLLVLFLFASVCWAPSFGQNISFSEEPMSLGTHNAVVLEMKDVEKKLAEKEFKNHMKDYGDLKYNKKAKEYYSEPLTLPMVSGSQYVTLYATLDDRSNLTYLTFWVDKGNEFVDGKSDPEGAKGMKDLAKELYIAIRKKSLTEEVKNAEKALKKLADHQKKLEKQNKDYHKNIEKAKENIVKAEKNIEKNLVEQNEQQALIKDQTSEVERVVQLLNSVGKDLVD